MKLWKRMFFYGLTCASLNLLSSCNKESSTETVQEVDYLKPLLGSWRQIEQNNFRVPYKVRKIFRNDNSYSFSVEDTINNKFRAFRAIIDNIAESSYRAHITEQYGQWSYNVVGLLEEWNYYISGNRLYESDERLDNIYIRE